MVIDVVAQVFLVLEKPVVDYIELIEHPVPRVLFDVVDRRFLGADLVLRQSFPIGMHTCQVVPWLGCGRFGFPHQLGGWFLGGGRLITYLELGGIDFGERNYRCGRALLGFEAWVDRVCKDIRKELGRDRRMLLSEGKS